MSVTEDFTVTLRPITGSWREVANDLAALPADLTDKSVHVDAHEVTAFTASYVDELILDLTSRRNAHHVTVTHPGKRLASNLRDAIGRRNAETRFRLEPDGSSQL